MQSGNGYLSRRSVARKFKRVSFRLLQPGLLGHRTTVAMRTNSSLSDICLNLGSGWYEGGDAGAASSPAIRVSKIASISLLLI
jgi:hypothetical protein